MTGADKLGAYWRELAERYAPILVDRVGLDPPLREVAIYALSGGKRLRPLLVELMGRVVAMPPATVTDVAIAVEYLHTASVLLDDLSCMDDARERREKAPAHVRFSEAEAILTAVALLSRAYVILLEAPTGRLDVNAAMARAAAETVARSMAPGQAVELGKGEVSVSSHGVLEVHARKTASLFVLIARLTARCGSANAATEEALVSFASLLGLAYQIIDDLEDRGDPREARANLARVAGAENAVELARSQLRSARAVLPTDVSGRFGACLDWLEAKLDASV
jgi:geranylgeranyl diphosphate synthase type II